MIDKKAAYVFPGQGSQIPGMGKRIYDEYEAARSVFQEADEALGIPLSKLCFEATEEELSRTVNAQPAMLTVSIAYLKAAQSETGNDLIKPLYMAGHSLGHYSALVAACVLPLADAVKLVRERGRLMYEAGLLRPGGMLAVLGSDEVTVTRLCDQSGTRISNINCPGQIVVSGSRADLDQFKKNAEKEGIRRVIALKVSGAFHSPLMQSAADELKSIIDDLKFKDPSVPVVSNVNAQALSDGESIKSELPGQVLNCVQWHRSVETMLGGGINAFYEIGQGTVLSGLIKRIDSNVEIRHIEDLLGKKSLS